VRPVPTCSKAAWISPTREGINEAHVQGHDLISFRSDYFPLELNLGLEYNPQQASDEAAVGMGINRIVVTDGVVSVAKRYWEA